VNSLAASFALRLSICVACSWSAWRFGGTELFVASLALFGLLLARPLIELASALRRRMRELAYRPVEGRFWAYRGTPVQVLEDAQHWRWVRAADVRKIVGFTASDGALALTYANRYGAMGQPSEPHFREDALIAHLAKERTLATLKFRHWVEREVAFPAQRLRERFGVKLEK